MTENKYSIELISGITQKGTGNFPLVQAKDVEMPDGTRLSEAGVTVMTDTEFSEESSNPIANKTVTKYANNTTAIINTKLPAPLTAAVGQTIRVKEVDENGIVTAVEAADTNIVLTQEDYDELLANGKMVSTTFYYIYEATE